MCGNVVAVAMRLVDFCYNLVYLVSGDSEGELESSSFNAPGKHPLYIC
jgi:hypothetical protein